MTNHPSQNAREEEVAELAANVEALLPKHKASLTITHNEHKSNYETVAQYADDDRFAPDWVSEDERTRAIETNEVWEIQWYPETPVGFHRIAASSLAALLEYFASQPGLTDKVEGEKIG